jgi:hypothetical protein
MSNKKSKDLFYSPKENLLFWIPGYTDNSDNVEDIVKMLMLHSKELSFLHVSYEVKDVKTFYVSNSSRYKNMRVFYLETQVVPKDAFSIGKDWTMIKWITN